MIQREIDKFQRLKGPVTSMGEVKRALDLRNLADELTQRNPYALALQDYRMAQYQSSVVSLPYCRQSDCGPSLLATRSSGLAEICRKKSQETQRSFFCASCTRRDVGDSDCIVMCSTAVPSVLTSRNREELRVRTPSGILTLRDEDAATLLSMTLRELEQ
eukprot:GEMP01052323.1.p1 GENE.GEMP01052323.1~~GEMP01052323.1.p1  ORF type:complete len:160 (+),score=29.76 GEMP01052323.1:147-626(+)